MKIRARYVVPVDAPPIENGALVVHDGLIEAVGTATEIRGEQVVDYQDAVILPGLVNAHTHLELSDLSGRVQPTGDFVDWLRRLMKEINEKPPSRENVQRAVRSGVEQSIRGGVTMIGDITRHPNWTREVLAKSKLSGVSFGEVIAIGNRRHLLSKRLTDAAATAPNPGRIRIGISPHAPYTVEPPAMKICAMVAEEAHMPLCIHLAETQAESTFTRSAQGELADCLRELGVWDDSIQPTGMDPVELAASTGLLRPQTLLAHANYVSAADLEKISNAASHVVYCPRTHHAFAHRPHRFREMLSAGINVCLGTDSLASNPSLSILDEMRFLHQSFPALSPETIAAMGTIHGARALGFGEEAGTITPGKRADLIVIPLRESPGAATWHVCLESTDSPVAVCVGGEWREGPAVS